MHSVYILMCQPTLKPEIAAITAQNVIYFGNPRSSDLLWVFDCIIVLVMLMSMSKSEGKFGGSQAEDKD